MNFERLKSIREDNDLKQQDIANILNVRQVNISGDLTLLKLKNVQNH